MHFDTRLSIFIQSFIFINIVVLSLTSDDQSFLSLIEYQRGGSSSNLIFAAPHGGFLGPNLTKTNFVQLPIGGCYNNTLDRCVYVYRDCLRHVDENKSEASFHVDGRCMLDRTSTSMMFSLTKAIAEVFPTDFRPFTILNKLTRQYVDPAEDLLVGTFLIESATRVYIDYHRLIAMSKESTRPATRGLFIEFVSHRNSQTIQLGYGFETFRSTLHGKPSQSTMTELFSRSGPNVIRGNKSLAFFLRQNGFNDVVPSDFHHQQNRTTRYRIATHSTRSHADQRFNSILFSYPIERLRSQPVKREAERIAKAIEQFMRVNQIQNFNSSASSTSFSLFLLVSLFFFTSFSFS